MFNIHCHSEYSALDGFSTVDEIADRCVELGLPGAFLTDHGLVSGHRAFAKAMSKRGLHAGFGMEGYQAAVHRTTKPELVSYVDANGRKRSKRPRDAAHVILLATSQKGLSNLYQLSDEANRTGFYHSPRLDWELLEKYNEGLVATSACLGGLVSRGIEAEDESALERYLDIFGERFYIELHTYAAEKQRQVNNELVSMAQTRGIPVVYANDAHYAKPDQYDLHELLLNIQMASDFRSPKNLSVDGEVDENHSHDGDCSCYHPQSLYIMGEDEVRQSLDYLPCKMVDEAIANSDVIAEMCKLELPEIRMHMPVFQVSKHVTNVKSNAEVLKELMWEGLEKRYPQITDEIRERAEYEYDTIVSVDLGDGATLGDYFLINWDWITRYCPAEGIKTGPGRGSVGGSILAYALGITHIDPLKYGLQFERFWNPGRAQGFPDIDTDVEKSRRGDVKRYLAKHYGNERVLSIGNHIRFRPKSAIERACVTFFGRERMKADNLYPILDEIKAIIDGTIDAGQQPDWPEIWELVGDQLSRYRKASQDWENIFWLAEQITGRISTYGVHASAVVVSDVDLPETMPCRSAKPDDSGERLMVTQVDMHEVEDCGFLKLDALGLRNLDTLSLVERFAKQDIDFWNLDYDNMPKDMYEMIENDLTLGLFQIEDGKTAKNVAKRIRPCCIEDLAAIVALNRPGPLRSGMVDRFIRRKDGEEDVIYKHPILEDILKPTYGDFLYQEQVIAYFRAIGYSLSDSDYIRKILGKKLAEEMRAEEPRYLERAKEHMDEDIAKEIWEEIIGFSKYSFNKAHAIGYAIILAATLYAKWKYPTEFIMASIQTNTKKVGQYILEARRMNVEVQPPDINNSEPEICLKNGKIYFGLADVKNVGKGAARLICGLRKDSFEFESYDDFLEELHFTSQEWDDLEVKPGRSPKQLCTQRAIDALKDAGAFDSLGYEEDPRERARLQKELIGVTLIDLYSDILVKNQDFLSDIPSLAELVEEEGIITQTYGAVAKITCRKTRADAHPRYANKEYAMLDLEWEGKTMKAVVFNKQWERYQSTLTENALCLMELQFNKNGAQVMAAQQL